MISPDFQSGHGLLLVGHGTRDAEGLAEHLETSRQLEALLPNTCVQRAFLELARPDILSGTDALVERGVQRIVVVPLLLFAGGHAKRDIPAAVQAARRRHSPIRIRVAPPLGCHPALLELSASRFRDAIGEAGQPAPTRLILVGRGGSDTAAVDELRRYAQILARLVAVRNHDVAFMAVAKPGLAEALAHAARLPDEELVVQPHLLFAGDVLGRLRDVVAEFERRFGGMRVRVARHLGPSPQLAEAIAQVARLTKHARSTN